MRTLIEHNYQDYVNKKTKTTSKLYWHFSE